MGRALSVSNIYSKKYSTYSFTGIWNDVLGEMSKNGIILIYGREKQGKTTIALKFADMISDFDRVLYISAEEGTGKEFKEAMQRAGIQASNRSIHFEEYIPLAELRQMLTSRKSRRVIVLDNMTIYNDEFKNGEFRRFVADFPSYLFVCIAHEEKGEPYSASAKIASKLAKVIIRVQGLTAFVGGRVPGGTIAVDKRTSGLYRCDNDNEN